MANLHARLNKLAAELPPLPDPAKEEAPRFDGLLLERVPLQIRINLLDALEEAFGPEYWRKDGPLTFDFIKTLLTPEDWQEWERAAADAQAAFLRGDQPKPTVILDWPPPLSPE